MENHSITGTTTEQIIILVAEDEDYNFELIEVLLSKIKTRLIRACNGAEVLTILEKEHPHIILMDMKMPVMDGYEATRQVRQKYPDLPVIALTAFARPEDEEKTLNAGCNAFISKPIRRQLLIETIERWKKP